MTRRLGGGAGSALTCVCVYRIVVWCGSRARLLCRRRTPAFSAAYWNGEGCMACPTAPSVILLGQGFARFPIMPRGLGVQTNPGRVSRMGRCTRGRAVAVCGGHGAADHTLDAGVLGNSLMVLWMAARALETLRETANALRASGTPGQPYASLEHWTFGNFRRHGTLDGTLGNPVRTHIHS